jgi:HSP20 family protein
MNREFSLVRCMPGTMAKRMEHMDVIVAPIADIYETTEAFVLKLDMPGTTREAITLSIDSGRLEIRGAVSNTLADNAGVILSEIGKKTYHRGFNLGDGIDRDRISAQFEDGILTVTLAKTEAVRPRSIQVN